MANVQHVNIPESGLHESKGISTAAENTVYVADGDGSGAFGKYARGLQNQVILETAADLPTASGGVITLLDNTTYIISGSLNIGGNVLSLGLNTSLNGTNRFTDGIVYTGTGIMINSSQTHLINELFLTASTGTVFALTGTGSETCVYTNSFITDCKSVGTFSTWRTVVFRSFSVISATDVTKGGLTCVGACTAFNMDDSLWSGILNGPQIDFGTATFDRIQVGGGNRFVTAVGEVAIEGAAGSANLNTGGFAVVSGNIFNGLGTALGTIGIVDLQWGFFGNAGVPDTHASAQGYIEGSALSTTIGSSSSDGTNAVLVNFGTAFVSDIADRFTISTAGRYTYNGLREAEFIFSANTFGVSASGSPDYTFYFRKTLSGGGATVIRASGSRVNITNTVDGSCAVTTIVSLDTGDYIELVVENVTSTADIVLDTVNIAAISR